MVSDFNTSKGRNLLRSSLKALKKLAFLRLTIVQNYLNKIDGNDLTDEKLIYAIIKLYPSNVAKQMLIKLLGTTELENENDSLIKDLYVNQLIKNNYETIAVHVSIFIYI